MAIQKLAGFLLLLAVSFASCKKDDNTPPPADKKLVIKLDNHLIGVDKIDSANVVLRKSGTTTPFFFRFQKGTTSLEALIDGLQPGTWTADLDLYTKEMPSGKHYQFVSTRPITINNSSANIEIDGPGDLDPVGDGWSARKVTSVGGNDIVVITPLDVNDPYFEVRVKRTQWNFVSVERLALFGSAVVAHKQWQCDGNCPGVDKLVFDKTLFLPFTQEIQNVNWSKNEIVVTVGNLGMGQYYEFEHTWTK